MTRDETIDFLHAMWQQLGTKSVSLDGIKTSVGTICLNAIDVIENGENNTKHARWERCDNFYRCSACGGFDSSGSDLYCRFCGRMMDNYVIQLLFGGEEELNKRLRIHDELSKWRKPSDEE